MNMDKQQAKNLIKNTFEQPFDKVRFISFVKNLLNSYDETKAFSKPLSGQYIKESYRDFINSLDRIGRYCHGDTTVDILIVRLNRYASVERARTAQRNFIAGYLKGDYGSASLKDAALVAFVSPDEEDWRFSLVKMDYKFEKTKTGGIKVKEESTPARRWSFLVGTNEKSHTAQSRLINILANDEHTKTLEEIEKAFDIETVTKEFFLKYRELFLRTKEELDKVVKNDPKIKTDFESKGVDTVDFAKKLLGQIVFLYFLQKKGWFGVPRGKDWGEGDKKFLRNLFDIAKKENRNYFNKFLEPLFYEALRLERPKDYYDQFNCRIPFLNGGLFDPINDYDWQDTDIEIPNEIFSNKRKTKEGDTGNGILDVFDRYNFTVKEDEPLEKEVAIDPEMLGKVFENLLEVKDRKSKGTYYTPREIVHYMCQESLTNYLATELEDKVSKEEIETLIKYGETSVEHDAIYIEKKSKDANYKGRYDKAKLPESIEKNAKLIDEKLASIRVCDPAVGSGAFPVGMMNEIIRTRNALTPYIGNNEKRTPYNFKRQTIQNCLYGVDIDPGAVEIAKLRLWLSLIVDEEEREKIQPLPNLDYKIVQGNSLLGFPYIPLGLEKIEQLKQKFFEETRPKVKDQLRGEINEAIKKLIANAERSLGYKVDFDFKIFFSEVFHEKKGFDVVIANPPYVEHKKLKALSKQFKKNYSTYSGTADLYVYFYERGIHILKNNSTLTYISSNKFIRTSYGEKLRGLLSSLAIQRIIDFTKVRVFDALVASCVVIVIKDKPTEEVAVTNINDEIINQISLGDYIEKNHQKISLKNFGSYIWQLEDNKKLKVKEKVELGSKKLGETKGINIYRGITTGYNQAFVINKDIKNKLIQADKRNAEIIKTLLQGRNIRKWFYLQSNKYLLQTGFDRDIKSDFPYIYSHLSNYEKELKKRDDQGKNWWNLRACKYYADFEKEKIIWGLTADKWAFAYDDEKHYLPSNGYILTSESKITIKYLLALLNSNLLKFYFGFTGIMTAGGAYTLKHETISALLIKEVPEDEQKSFIDLVDKILAITKDDDYLQNPAKQAKVHEYERQIDQLVYKLYGLMPEEIEIVENS